MQLDDIFRKLEEYDKAEGFRMEDESSLWYGVLYDPTRQRIVGSGP